MTAEIDKTQLADAFMFDNLLDAQMLKARPQSGGIPAWIPNEHMHGLRKPTFTSMVREVSVQVRGEDAQRAREIYEEEPTIEEEYAEEDGLKCPACEKQYAHPARSFRQSLLLVLTFGLARSLLTERWWRCGWCEHLFRSEEAPKHAGSPYRREA